MVNSRNYNKGDRVRSKSGSGFEYTLGRNGYFCHTTNTLNKDTDSLKFFNSDRYEKVN